MVDVIASVEDETHERILEVSVLIGFFRHAVSDLPGSLAGIVVAAVNQRALGAGAPERLGCKLLTANSDPQARRPRPVRWLEVRRPRR
jgi:hypothetical protein